ncbi:MAG: ABC transporter substrate-binding protein [Bacteroidales bacterium]|nr:ABC transporter substrate-binding protein [Bacteroidales bacterium]
MRKKKGILAVCLLPILCILLSGCSAQSDKREVSGGGLLDGVYLAEFHTDSSMFRVNEACEGKGTLTVENGEMTIHISLGSKKIVNLYLGLAKDAEKDGAVLLEPVTDKVTYSDGLTEEVYGFDVPVPVLDEEFDLALIGTKGKWYDHKVTVSNPEPLQKEPRTEGFANPKDGKYTVELTFEGGSKKAEILSPAVITVAGESVTATVQWSSSNYDYMIVDGEKYLPVSTEGGSVFEIPVSAFDEQIDVIGDTVAMSKPHEIEYTLTFHSDTVKAVAETAEPEELVYESSMELQYAENFAVDYYEGGYRLLTVTDGTKIWIVPEGKEAPKSLGETPVVLKRPIKNIYLVSSSVMDMFAGLNALDTVRLSGQKEENWYIEDARDAMARGDILYAGKYNQPDYELIVSENCSLAIENRMISHSPEVREMLEDFGIPVMIEYSSYESHPLGRVEWVRFFGALTGREEEAQKIFEEQTAILEAVTADEKTDKTVAFFFITSNNLVQVRQSSDYIPKMIELAGGKYVFENVGEEESGRSTVNIQIEEFYEGAKDADFLIYNSSIDGGVASVEELLDKCAVLKDFKAVREGNVFCTSNDMYQQSLSIAYLIEDMHNMIRGENEEEMKYLFRLK